MAASRYAARRNSKRRDPSRKPGTTAGLVWCQASEKLPIRSAGCRTAFDRFLPRGVEFDRFGHEVIAHGIEVGGKLAADPRQPLAAVGGLDQKFLSRLHHIDPKLIRLRRICALSLHIQGCDRGSSYQCWASHADHL
jgi:hypothetical protein